MNCQHCNSPMILKSGIKNNKKWSGDFCTNPDCKYVNWHREGSTQFVKQGQELKVREEPNWDKIREEKTEEIDFLNRRNNAVLIALELYKKGDMVADMLGEKIQEWIQKLDQMK